MDEHRTTLALAQGVNGIKGSVSLVRAYRLACSPAEPKESISEFQSALAGNI
jgi:hypothetical protein